MKTEDLVSFCLSRECMYRLLARIYYAEMDKKTMNVLTSLQFEEPVGVDTLDENLARFQQTVAAYREADDQAYEELAADYARCFLGAGLVGDNFACPYESVFTSPDGLVAQDAFEAMRQQLTHSGLKLSDADLMDDHIAIELGYIATLCQQAADAAQNGQNEALKQNLQMQSDFIDAHILNWLPAFCRKTQACPVGEFYPLAAQLTQELVTWDKALVEELL